MSSQPLEQNVRERLGEDAVLTEVFEKDWYRDKVTGQTWKSHLIRTFEVRLKGCDPDKHSLVAEIEGFLEALAHLEQGQTLATFSADRTGRHFGGWAIDGKIVYCVSSGEGAV